MHSNYLKTDGFDGPNGTGDDFVAGGRVSNPSPSHPLPHPQPLAFACLPNIPLPTCWSSYHVWTAVCTHKARERIFDYH